MPISAQILQLFILVLCPRPKLCTGVSSCPTHYLLCGAWVRGRDVYEKYNFLWTVKGSKKRTNECERGKMVKVKAFTFSFLSTFYINIIALF